MNSSYPAYHQPSSDTNDSDKRPFFDISKPSQKVIGNTSVVIRPNYGVDLKLFIGQVPKEWDEGMVTDFFSGYGEILESQVMRDPKTNVSKGCAFVKFASMTKAEEAKKLIESKGITLPGVNHAIQIRWADGEDQRLGVDEHTNPKLFVGSIPKSTTEENLRDVFTQFGTIEELVLMKDPDGTPKGSAFIKFKLKEEALMAMRFLNGNVYIGGSDKPMEVRFAETAIKKKSFPAAGQTTGTTDASPYQQHGAQRSTYMPPANPVTPVAQGAPFNKYTTADGNVYYWNPYTRQTQWEEPPSGSLVYPEPPEQPYVVKSPLTTMQHKPGPQGCNLFVFHLPSEWTEETLYSYFKDFGTMTSCRIMKDRQTNRSKGFAFVSYDNPTSAQMAIQKMNGFQAGNKRLKVEIKKGGEDNGGMTNSMPSAVKFTPY